MATKIAPSTNEGHRLRKVRLASMNAASKLPEIPRDAHADYTLCARGRARWRD